MAYVVTWSPGTQETLRGALGLRASPHGREAWMEMLIDHVSNEISSFPRLPNPSPGQSVTGHLDVGTCRVHYQICLDTHTALVTEVVAR